MSSRNSVEDLPMQDPTIRPPLPTHSSQSKKQVVIDWRPSTFLPLAPVIPTDDMDDSHDSLHHVLSHISEHHYPTSKPGTDGPRRGISNTGDTVDYDKDEIYNRFTPFQKTYMTIIVAFCSLCAPFSTTCIFSATPEIASAFGTTGSIINVTNAVYLVCMAISPLYWGPLSQTYGRKPIYVISSFGYFVGSLGTSLSTNLAMFIVFRCLTAFAGTSFLAVGAGTIGDIYRATERGSAMGLYLAGVTVGPAFGPVISGLIVAYRPWQDVFWLTTGLGGLAFLLCLLALPETAHYRVHDQLCRERGKRFVMVTINPLCPLALFIYPNLLLGGIVSSCVLWSMYSLLTPIRYVINPRFHIDSPALSGLFNLAPGCGYLVGTFIGGRYADHAVKKWMVRRGGKRLPEDRLRSILYMLLLLLPGTILLYGWSIDRDVGGIALPVVALFFNGIAQLVVFSSLNVYCVDVLQSRSTEVIGANYAMRYLFAAAASSAILPLIQAIGVGWATTISAVLLFISGGLTWAMIHRGEAWRLRMDEWLLQRHAAEKAAVAVTEV